MAGCRWVCAIAGYPPSRAKLRARRTSGRDAGRRRDFLDAGHEGVLRWLTRDALMHAVRRFLFVFSRLILCTAPGLYPCPATSDAPRIRHPRPGKLPKWPKGSDCKSAVVDFTGSNPVLATSAPFDPPREVHLVLRARSEDWHRCHIWASLYLFVTFWTLCPASEYIRSWTSKARSAGRVFE